MPPGARALIVAGALLALLALLLVGVLALRGWALRTPAPPLGVRPADARADDARLAPCPDTPNCVSSFADPADAEHRLEPLPVRGDPAAALAAVDALMAAEPRTREEARAPHYRRYRVHSRWLALPDDVEFLVWPDARLLHMRSASRLGRDDLGVNRARMERLRARLQQESDAF